MILEICWFIALTVIAAWTAYGAADGVFEGRMEGRMLVACLCAMFALIISHDFSAGVLYHWLQRTLPEPKTSIHDVTAVVGTVAWMLAQMFSMLALPLIVHEKVSQKRHRPVA